jgi:hypothetical protein
LRDGRGPEASYAALRRSQIHHRLVHVPAIFVLPALLGALLWAPVMAVYRLALKQPGHAGDEILAALLALARLGPLAKARRRAAKTAVLPRRDLRKLQATWKQVYADRRDARLARTEAQRAYFRPNDLERLELRRLGSIRRTALTLVLLVTLGLAAAAFGSWLGVLADGGRIVGGGLLAAGSTAREVWQAATSGWVDAGLGAQAPGDPVLAPLTVAAWIAGGSLQTAVNVAFVAAIPLAALGAWFATGCATRVVWARVAGALAWAVSPVFLASISSGRVGSLLAHLVLPWAVLALVRSVGGQARDEVVVPGARALTESGTRMSRAAAREAARRATRGSLGAAGAAGLLLAVAVAGAPSLLLAAVTGVLAGLIVAPRDRWFLLLALLPSAVVAAPFWTYVARTWADGGWRLLLAEPGAPIAAGQAPSGWHLLLGQPGVPQPWFAGRVPASVQGLAELAPWVFGIVVLVFAAASLMRRRGAGGARLAWFVAAIGVTLGMVAASQGQWTGPASSLVLLGLGGAALIGTRTKRRVAVVMLAHPRAGKLRAVRRAGAAVVGVLLITVLGAGAASWVDAQVDGRRVGAIESTNQTVVPAVGAVMQAPPRAARVLQLGVDAGTVTYTLMAGSGTRLVDSSVVLAGHATDAPAQDRLEALIGALVASRGTSVTSGASADIATELGALGIGAVQVAPGGDPDLITTLDLAGGLQRVTEGDGTALWRIAVDGAPLPGWARLVTGTVESGTVTPTAPAQMLDSDGRTLAQRILPSTGPRTLVLAAGVGTGWRATLDGRLLRAVDVDGLQAFEVPESAGLLHVEYVSGNRALWLAVAGIVLGVFVLLALPVGRRRGR